MKRIWKRYIWRYSVKGAMWAVRLAIIFCAAWAASLVLEVQPNGWALVAVILVYGIWEITRTIRAMSPNITIVTGRTLELQAGATMVVGTGELDKAVQRIVEQQRRTESYGVGR